jgi:hypothetical protein
VLPDVHELGEDLAAVGESLGAMRLQERGLAGAEPFDFVRLEDAADSDESVLPVRVDELVRDPAVLVEIADSFCGWADRHTFSVAVPSQQG